MVIEPFRQAAATICIRQRWAPELIRQRQVANIGCLEQVDTGLAISAEDEHTRTPDVPSMAVAPPSMRKSSAHKFITKTLLSGGRVRKILKEGSCLSETGTIKGHRTNLYNYRRSGIATDECSCAYKTKDTEEGKGLHFPARQTMCQWVHCESDSAVAAIAPDKHANYSFFHLVCGQVRLILEIVGPRSGGFSKRFALAMRAFRLRQNPTQDINASRRFLIDFYDWLSFSALGADR